MNARRIPLSLVVGALLVGVLALIALVSLAWLPYPIEDTSGGRFEGFSADHLLGTDRLGHDLASRMMVGARIALVVGLGAVAVATLIGVSVGLVIALARPWVDDVASALLDVVIAFPTLLLAMLIVGLRCLPGHGHRRDWRGRLGRRRAPDTHPGPARPRRAVRAGRPHLGRVHVGNPHPPRAA